MVTILRFALLPLTLFALIQPAAASPVGLATDFNVLVFGNFTAQYSDAQGRLAAGRNVSLNGYSVAWAISSAATWSAATRWWRAATSPSRAGASTTAMSSPAAARPASAARC